MQNKQNYLENKALKKRNTESERGAGKILDKVKGEHGNVYLCH